MIRFVISIRCVSTIRNCTVAQSNAGVMHNDGVGGGICSLSQMMSVQ